MNSTDCKIEKYDVMTYIDARGLLKNLGVKHDRICLIRKSIISSTFSSILFIHQNMNVATYRLSEGSLEIYTPARPARMLSLIEEI